MIVPELEGRLVLLVDDEESLGAILARRLQRIGMRCLRATGGHEAFAIYKANDIDIVLADLRMPNGDGVQLLKAIRATGSDTKVVLMSGFADFSARDLYALGANALLPKPFRKAELIGTLMRVCSGGPPAANPVPFDIQHCPHVERCQMFPVFQNESALRSNQHSYCYSMFESCERYKLASNGTMPRPRLLPDGSLAPAHWTNEPK